MEIAIAVAIYVLIRLFTGIPKHHETWWEIKLWRWLTGRN